jgi:hypothetical protein
MSKPNIGRHAAAVANRMTFAQAYAHILAHPTATYQTTGDRTSFTARATTAAKGRHKGEKVIRFFPHGEYAYECCWGFTTNCYGSYIDCYTAAI